MFKMPLGCSAKMTSRSAYHRSDISEGYALPAILDILSHRLSESVPHKIGMEAGIVEKCTILNFHLGGPRPFEIGAEIEADTIIRDFICCGFSRKMPGEIPCESELSRDRSFFLYTIYDFSGKN